MLYLYFSFESYSKQQMFSYRENGLSVLQEENLGFKNIKLYSSFRGLICDNEGHSWHVNVCDGAGRSWHVNVCDGAGHSWHVNVTMRNIRDMLMYVIVRDIRDMWM